jgi:hypothetical protein
VLGAAFLEVPLQIDELGAVDQNLDDCPLGHVGAKLRCYIRCYTATKPSKMRK